MGRADECSTVLLAIKSVHPVEAGFLDSAVSGDEFVIIGTADGAVSLNGHVTIRIEARFALEVESSFMGCEQVQTALVDRSVTWVPRDLPSGHHIGRNAEATESRQE